MVPVLFVIGVIGWGFFAIDRFSERKDIRIINSQKPRKSDDSSWKKQASEWLNNFIARKKTPQKPVLHETNNIPVKADETGLTEEIIEIQEAQAEETAPLEDETIIPLQASVPVYLYQLDKKGLPRLRKVTRQIAGKRDASFAYRALIMGPDTREENRDFIDSFPAKPKILSVKKSDKIVTLNFDSTFGKGVSFQTLRYQLRQLYEQAKHTEGALGIRILVNGKYKSTMSGDGIQIPKIIDEKFFSAS